MGLEPTALSLGSLTSAAWLGGNAASSTNRHRWKPLGTAGIEGLLARDWRAVQTSKTWTIPVLISSHASLRTLLALTVGRDLGTTSFLFPNIAGDGASRCSVGSVRCTVICLSQHWTNDGRKTIRPDGRGAAPQDGYEKR
jgi:hypothetical protein